STRARAQYNVADRSGDGFCFRKHSEIVNLKSNVLTLLVLQGPDKGRRFELPARAALIGRESRALPMNDKTVSRRHAELLPNDGNWILKALGSSNGTYVNGSRVTNPYALKLGDQIRVGKTILVFGAQPGMKRGSGGEVGVAGGQRGVC